MSKRASARALKSGASPRLDEVLQVGLKCQPVPKPCCFQISKGFDDLSALNGYKIKNSTNKESSFSDDTECSICLQSLSIASPSGMQALEALYEPITTTGAKRDYGEDTPLYNGCGHAFHRECIRKWVISYGSTTCPNCVQPISPIIINELRSNSEYSSFNPETGQLLFTEYAKGTKNYFEGSKGNEYKVRTEFPNGDKQHFEGPKGQEQLIRAEFTTGNVQHFVGRKGEERLVRSEFPDESVQHFEGPRGEERMVYVKFADEKTVYLEGPKGEERMTRAEFADGKTAYFNGPKDKERKVRVDFPNGNAQHFTGEKGEEHIWKATLANGDVVFLDGPKGQERKVRWIFANGAVREFQGPKGQERKVRSVSPDGKVVKIFDGPRGEERLMGTEQASLA